MASRVEQGDDLVVSSEKSQGLAGGLEPAHDLCLWPRMAMRRFDPVVQPLVGPMIGTAAIVAEGKVVASQLVGHHDVRLPPSAHRLAERPSAGPGIAAFLNQDVQHITPVIDDAPQPVRLTADGDRHLVDVPLVAQRWPVAPNLGSDLRSEPFDPCPGRFVAHRHTAFSEQILNVPQAQVETVIAPDHAGDHRPGKAIPLQSRRRGQIHHSKKRWAPGECVNLIMPFFYSTFTFHQSRQKRVAFLIFITDLLLSPVWA